MRRAAVTIIAIVVLSLTAAVAVASELPPGGTFVDDDDLPEEGWIEAIYAEGITRGCNPPASTLFCSDDPVTRAEVASFLTRVLGLPDGPEAFVDDDDSIHERSINALAAAGITRGCNPPANDRFCPARDVTRAEMGAMIVRSADWAAANGRTGIRPVPETSGLPFDDMRDSIFEGEIARLYASGITSGCDESNYCPTKSMIRRHLAVFLGRLAQLTPDYPPPRPRELARFTTYHPCCQSRVTNIHIIADAIDGAVVQPGDTFSLNQAAGPRTEAKGYVPAGAIIGGEVYCCDHPVNIGGGVSQMATTLFNAAYFAGLEIVTHKPHSIYFSRYPMGREATIVYPTPDLVFRNDTEVPLTVDTYYTSSSITARIIGFNDFRTVSTSSSGFATTADGGTVVTTRVIRFKDGSTETQSWSWTYKPFA
jgi:hypothetical protein